MALDFENKDFEYNYDDGTDKLLVSYINKKLTLKKDDEINEYNVGDNEYESIYSKYVYNILVKDSEVRMSNYAYKDGFYEANLSFDFASYTINKKIQIVFIDTKLISITKIISKDDQTTTYAYNFN